MSRSFVSNVLSLTIPDGTAVSNTLNAKEHYGDAVGLGLISPSTLDALTFKWQVSADGSTWADYQEGETLGDLPIPAASNATSYTGIVMFPYIRLAASGNVAADRVFAVTKSYTA